MADITSCCTCFGNSVALNYCPSSTPTSRCGDCLTLGRILVGCENSIAPCATTDTLTIPFDCFCFPCENPQFKVINESEIEHLTVLSITKDGLVVKPTGTGRANSKVEIRFKAICADDCNTLSDYGSVVIYLKDICKGILCGDGEVCNDCTGNCDDVVIDLAGTRPAVDETENTSGLLI
jgi:hypothetical protein